MRATVAGAITNRWARLWRHTDRIVCVNFLSFTSAHGGDYLINQHQLADLIQLSSFGCELARHWCVPPLPPLFSLSASTTVMSMSFYSFSILKMCISPRHLPFIQWTLLTRDSAIYGGRDTTASWSEECERSLQFWRISASMHSTVHAIKHWRKHSHCCSVISKSGGHCPVFHGTNLLWYKQFLAITASFNNSDIFSCSLKFELTSFCFIQELLVIHQWSNNTLSRYLGRLSEYQVAREIAQHPVVSSFLLFIVDLSHKVVLGLDLLEFRRWPSLIWHLMRRLPTNDCSVKACFFLCIV